jgi:tetratricopeptide (TPR) repeat protein
MRVGAYSFIVWLFFLLTFSVAVRSQPKWTFDPFGKESKPKEYEDKKLGSEKTADKKFTLVRRFLQNNISHYNYYFNANNKLNLVIERARESQRDEYSKLLSFYPYSLDQTATQQVELDSVIYKSTAGILLHDLRSDWVDDMYLLIGKSYYYRKVFDSATLTFQFINYNLFPRKKNEDEDRVIGAGMNAAATKLSIADKEKRNLYHRFFKKPPSRNSALLWLARTYIDMEQYGEAAGMINILQDDPNFPKRLKPELNQITSYWYFKQHAFDSAARYLDLGLSSAPTKEDRSRWRYLLGQMYELSQDYDKADACYTAAAKSTVSPLMDIYARLNRAKMLRNKGNIKELDNSISALVKMAKKDKFEKYRDIIFHSAGQLSMQKPDTTSAVGFYEKSLKVNEDNLAFKNKAHLELGRITYQQRKYRIAADHYDSLDLNDPLLREDSMEVASRKSSLRKVADQFLIMETEDSLQKIAAMPAAERDLFIKKLSRKLNKEAGNNDVQDNGPSGPTLSSSGKNNETVDLFASSSKGEWYFYNSGMKSKGFNEFKSKWGRRDNVDNWRRKSAMDANAMMSGNPGNADPLAPAANPSDPNAGAAGGLVPNSYDALMAKVPITAESIDSSNQRIAEAMFQLAALFQGELQDYEEAIYTYELYLKRFPEQLRDGEIYLGLAYCYGKIGDKEKANYYQQLLTSNFANTRAAAVILNPSSLQPDKNNPQVAAQYQEIYDLFMKSAYDEAMVRKKKADSIYGKQYWTPQLAYMEALYYVKCDVDTVAIEKLQEFKNEYPTSPLAEKAGNLIDVLSRRASIESYLNNLNVSRVASAPRIAVPEMPKDTISAVNSRPVIPAKKQVSIQQAVKSTEDSTIVKPVVQALPAGPFLWAPEKPQLLLLLLEGVEGVYVNEARNAYNRFNGANGITGITIARDTLAAGKDILVFNGLKNMDAAMQYFEKVKRSLPVQVSWIPKQKISMLVISQENLEVLKRLKNTGEYRTMINGYYPGKF